MARAACDGVDLVQRAGVLGPGPGHAQARDDGQRGGDEDRGEVGQQLQAVVVDPAVVGGPVQGQVLQPGGDGVGEHVPAGGHNAHPLARGEEHHNEDDAVEHPEGVQGQVEPQVQADLGGVPLGLDQALVVADPVRGGALGGAHLPAGADDQQDEEHVQEVLPAQPRRDAHGCAVGQFRVARVGGHERFHGIQAGQPAGQPGPAPAGPAPRRQRTRRFLAHRPRPFHRAAMPAACLLVGVDMV